ncbi:MAG: hypothetical protein KAS32_09215 [Candidatus Peribacteraceae bacterium]|nr:hypothetical protein [Candidatus Peribacteraceae bacterium]
MISEIVVKEKPKPLSKKIITENMSGPKDSWETRVNNLGQIQALELSKLEYMFTLKFPTGKSVITKNIAMELDNYFKTDNGALSYTLVTDLDETNKTVGVTLFPLVEAA